MIERNVRKDSLLLARTKIFNTEFAPCQSVFPPPDAFSPSPLRRMLASDGGQRAFN
jgi:hypothetical protein